MNLRLLITRAHNDHSKSKRKHDIGPDEKKYTKACQRGTPSPPVLIYYIVSVQMEEFKGVFVWLDKEDSKEKTSESGCLREALERKRNPYTGLWKLMLFSQACWHWPVIPALEGHRKVRSLGSSVYTWRV